jgi:hypothetical protein
VEAREFIHVSFTPVCDYCVKSERNENEIPEMPFPKHFRDFIPGDGGT